MKTKLSIFLLLLAIIGFIGVFGLQQYNKKTVDAGSHKADFSLSASEFVDLLLGFNSDEEISEVYGGKVIELTGEIIDITSNKENFDILLYAEDLMSDVNVNLVPTMKDKVKKVNVGDQITVQAFFSGMLVDVELTRGVIIEK